MENLLKILFFAKLTARKGNEMTHKTLFQIITLVILNFLLQPVLANPANQPLKNFNAIFDVYVFGFDIGDANHKLACNNSLCQLTSEAIPTKWARRWVNEEMLETIQLDQSNNNIMLLEYKQLITRHKNNETTKKTVTLRRDIENNQIKFIEEQKIFAAPLHAFDMISITYAIQYLVKNQQPISDLFLQDKDYQRKITFSESFKKDKISLNFAELIPTLHFAFSNEEVDAELWLIPELNYFPGKIKVHNKEKNRTVTLRLQNKPER